MVATACLVFDKLSNWWESPPSARVQSNVLVAVFVLSIVAGLTNLAGATNHILLLGAIRPPDAIRYSFNFLLFFEMITLSFSIAQSTTKAIAKQFQIMSLIFLRTSFEEISHWSLGYTFAEQLHTILRMASDAGAALIIFYLLFWFYRFRAEKQIANEEERLRFIAIKKIIALLVFIALQGIVLYDFVHYLKNGVFTPSYSTFYLVLIFADMLLMLLALRFVTHYPNIFRYSAYVLITIFIRIALMAPVYVNAVIGIGTMLFGIGVSVIHRKYFAVVKQKQ